MEFWLGLGRLAGRPGVAVPGVALGAVLAVLVVLFFPTLYVSSATVVLTTSPTSEDATGSDPSRSQQVNPLLNFNEGLTTTLAILVLVMNSPQVVGDFVDVDGGRSAVTVTDVGGTELLGTKGPFLFITGTSTVSPQAAQAVVERARQRASKELADRQAALNVPSGQLISLLYVVTPTRPEASSLRRFEVAAVAFLFGMLVVLAAGYVRAARRPTPDRTPGDGSGTRAAGPADPVADGVGRNGSGPDTAVTAPAGQYGQYGPSGQYGSDADGTPV